MSKRLAFAFLLLGVVGLAGHHAALPWPVTVEVSELQREDDGFLVSDLSRPWPFKINKRALDRFTVTLPDGSELEQVGTRDALLDDRRRTGFYVHHPEVVFHLDDTRLSSPSATLSVEVPTRTRGILRDVPLGISAVLFLASWFGAGFRTSLKPPRYSLALAGGSLVAALVGFLGLLVAKGTFVWLSLLALLVGSVIAAAALLRAEAAAKGAPARSPERLVRLALVLGSVLGTCIVFESYLAWNSARLSGGTSRAAEPKEEWFQLPNHVVERALSRAGVLTLPRAWEHRSETVEGASRAFTWHGALHIEDEDGFRRINGPFAAKKPETLRIMVIGDSLTYGKGIDEEWTYSRLLERSLFRSHRLEVLNLGRSGHQSEDILGMLQRFLRRLNPDLVVYAVCLNDFLPSGQDQYQGFTFPLPDNWKNYLSERTYLARFLSNAYSALLLALDLQADFFDDILAGVEEYQERFARDVVVMNELVRERGLPPMLGIVFHQSPGGDERAWVLIEIAERALEAAGFDLISVKPWRERYAGRRFPVSRWEGHPSELAHAALAEELHAHLLEGNHLDRYRKAP